jgi:hypothetical protein
VVIGVETDVFEVVVFATGANALLRVRCARRQTRNRAGPLIDLGLLLAEEDRHKLVHAGIGEQQIRRVGHQARRRHNGVLLRLEEVEERLADFGARHLGN